MFKSLFGSPSPPPAPVADAPSSPPLSLLERLKQGIQKTRAGLVDKVEDVLQGRKEIDAELLEELEYTLIAADIGVSTAGEILERIRQRVDRKQVNDPAELRNLIREHLLGVLESSERPFQYAAEPPTVILLVGVNGSGKTTTAGKLAARFKSAGKSVLLCAADTFRAAAIEQLQVWGGRTATEVIAQGQGADPSAVVFDAIHAARARQIDVLVADTAGRRRRQLGLLLAFVEQMQSEADEGAGYDGWLREEDQYRGGQL